MRRVLCVSRVSVHVSVHHTHYVPISCSCATTSPAACCAKFPGYVKCNVTPAEQAHAFQSFDKNVVQAVYGNRSDNSDNLNHNGMDVPVLVGPDSGYLDPQVCPSPARLLFCILWLHRALW